MNTPNNLRKVTLVLGCALSLVAGVLSAKADTLPTQSRAATPAALPVAGTFTKTEGEKGPYVLALKNTSATALKVHVVVAESVKSHAKPGERKSDYTIDAGKSVSVETLAAHDKVTVSADGFAPLELTVP